MKTTEITPDFIEAWLFTSCEMLSRKRLPPYVNSCVWGFRQHVQGTRERRTQWLYVLSLVPQVLPQLTLYRSSRSLYLRWHIIAPITRCSSRPYLAFSGGQVVSLARVSTRYNVVVSPSPTIPSIVFYLNSLQNPSRKLSPLPNLPTLPPMTTLISVYCRSTNSVRMPHKKSSWVQLWSFTSCAMLAWTTWASRSYSSVTVRVETSTSLWTSNLHSTSLEVSNTSSPCTLSKH